MEQAFCSKTFVFQRLLLLLVEVVIVLGSDAERNKPNFVIFLADDLGIGDIGCFGNDTIRTPAIDSISEEGAKLKHNLAAAATCTPSRAAFLTGRYPIRSGMASNVEPGLLTMITTSDCTAGLPQNETTFAEILKGVGYSTALIGKWHLGTNLMTRNDHHFHPLKQGFDYFYGFLVTNINDCGDDGKRLFATVYGNYIKSRCLWSVGYLVILCTLRMLGLIRRRTVFLIWSCILVSVAWTYVRHVLLAGRIMCVLMKNYDVIEQPLILDTISTRMVNQANAFIERSAAHGPFLLYFSFLQTHTALFNMKNFTGSSKHGKYGDNVEEMDWMVGKVLSKLSELGFEENTFVYFTSDHGGFKNEIAVLPHRIGEREGGWNGIYKGGKAQNWEGGIRVPTVVRYPPMIPRGIEISVPTSTMDVFPTIASLAGVDLPRDRVIDGRDLMPLLRGKSAAPPHDFLFHYCGQWLTAATCTVCGEDDMVYKVHYNTANLAPGTDHCTDPMVCPCTGDQTTFHEPPLVFNLVTDPSESNALAATDRATENIVSRVDDAILKHKKTVLPVPVQISAERLQANLLLAPCCNFPLCSCKEEYYDLD
ncbi:arylsulfatase D-like [Ptychodera flava]|uniref:arylsulfatase D-like n=1 Tax=Ptychodera flava TaxID=63121 RepID=UPI00396AA57D